MNDASLMRQLATDRGDDAMRALYRTYGGELYGFALHALGDRGAAEELVQEVFLRVWRNGKAYDASRSSVRTWIYAIARNSIVDHRRRASARPPAGRGERDGGEAAGSHGADSIEVAMLGWQVRMALDRLTPDHRQVIRLAHLQGMTLREIAEVTGVPLGTVKSRCSYALRNLRLALDELGVAP